MAHNDGQPATKKGIRFKPRVKVWLETEGRYVFGFGLCEILQGVEAAGSMKMAAVRLGKSYRYIWGRIKVAEEALGQTLVETQIGGKGTQRSLLTPVARRLVKDFLAVRQRMLQLVGKEFERRFPIIES